MKKSLLNNEGPHVTEARKVLSALQQKENSLENYKKVLRSCASHMNSFHIKEFKFNSDGKKYKAKLHRPQSNRTSIQKLYTLVRRGELSLDDFLSLVNPNEEAIKDFVSSSVYNLLSEVYNKPLTLTVKEIGDNNE